MTRTMISLASCAALALAGAAFAEPKGQKGGGGGQQHQQKGAKGPGHAKHQHHNHGGHAMLGAKLKHDGKHAVGKFKGKDVTAEVKRGKVVAMAAGDMPAKRVRTKMKMAAADPQVLLASWNGGFQLAQYDDYYYGYCFDDGYDYDCYWYPAEDVDYQDYTWDDYDPDW